MHGSSLAPKKKKKKTLLLPISGLAECMVWWPPDCTHLEQSLELDFSRNQTRANLNVGL